jgi:hypothetical protein
MKRRSSRFNPENADLSGAIAERIWTGGIQRGSRLIGWFTATRGKNLARSKTIGMIGWRVRRRYLIGASMAIE